MLMDVVPEMLSRCVILMRAVRSDRGPRGMQRQEEQNENEDQSIHGADCIRWMRSKQSLKPIHAISTERLLRAHP